MSLAATLTKLAVVGVVLKFSYGSAEDMISGILSGVEVNAAHSEMKQIHGKLMEFYTFNSRYPRTKVELVKYLDGEFDNPVQQVITDPWETEYTFFTPKVEILCAGPDKKILTGDDLKTDYPKNVRLRGA